MSGRPPQNPTEVLPALTEVVTGGSTAAERCSACGAPRGRGDVFCEACGYDFVNGASVGTRWEVVISADRERFESLAAAGLEYPDDFEPRTLELDGEQLLRPKQEQCFPSVRFDFRWNARLLYGRSVNVCWPLQHESDNHVERQCHVHGG